MRIKVAQASNRIVIKLENGRNIEIFFFAAKDQDDPSLCTIASNGRENTIYQTRHTGKMQFWEFSFPER